MNTFARILSVVLVAAPLVAHATPGLPKTLSVLLTPTGPTLRASVDEIDLEALVAPQPGSSCTYTYSGAPVVLKLGFETYHFAAITVAGTPTFNPGGPG